MRKFKISARGVALIFTAVLVANAQSCQCGRDEQEKTPLSATPAPRPSGTATPGEPTPSPSATPAGDTDISFVEDPFSISFSSDGRSLTKLAASGKSAFFLAKSDGSQIRLKAPVQRTKQTEQTTFTLKTEDGRDATIAVTLKTEGAYQVKFDVNGKKSDEFLGVDFQVDSSEGFYGLMERVRAGSDKESWAPGITEGFNLRGQKVPLVVKATNSSFSPFYVSSAGYGVWVESSWPGNYSFGAESPDRVSIDYEGDNLTLRIFPGPTPLDAVARYARTSGTTILPPRWAFGIWRWRNEVWNLPKFYNGTTAPGPYNSMVMEDILMMEALGVPPSVYLIDRPWGPGDFGYDDLEWDTSRFPQPVQMIQWIKQHGARTILWISPFLMGEMKNIAALKGYSIEPASQVLQLDFTNPSAKGWWQGYLERRIKEGIAGFKLDRGEESIPDGKFKPGQFKDGTSWREGHNAYPAWYASAVHEAFTKSGKSEFVILPRATWQGSQTHATPWGGDVYSVELGLRASLISIQRNAAMNFPIWGSDMCGYKTVNRDLCRRWIPFAAFSPLMLMGPMNNHALWSMPPAGSDPIVDEQGYRYNPVYDTELLAIWNFYANLHFTLGDYIYKQAKIASETGTPIVRPMIFMHPDRDEYKDMFEQYYFGPDIIVAPVWRLDQARTKVHVPEGEWIDAWEGTQVTSQSTIEIDTPAYKIPILVRKDSGVDFGDLKAKWRASQAKVKTKPNLGQLAAGQK